MATAIYNILHLDLPLPREDIEGNDDLERDIDALVDGCQEAIESYTRVIQALKVKRNYGCAKISGLPDEVLERVFRFILEEGRGSAGCIPITHVCGRWRRIALASPALWTSVVVDGITHPAVLRTLFTRSQSLPLDITLSTLKYPWTVQEARSVICSTMSALPRARRLWMIIHRPFYSLFESLSPTPTPLLEHFEACLEPTEHKLTFPFLAPNRPLLHTIMTTSGNLGLLAFASPSITMFRFHISKFDQSARHLLMPALRCMPNLQVLSLQHLDDMVRLPAGFVEDPVGGSIVSLPHLRQLSLSGRVVDIAWVLGHLTFPSTTNVYLQFFYEGITPSQFLLASLGSRLSQVLDILADSTSREERSYGSEYGAMLSASGEPQYHGFVIWPLRPEPADDKSSLGHHMTSRIPDGHIHLQIEQNAPHGREVYVQRTLHLLGLLPLQAIRTLRLLPYHIERPGTFRWTKVLRPLVGLVQRMTSLEGLSVTQWDLNWFSELIGFDPARYQYQAAEGGVPSPPAILFPSVKVLAFDEINLDDVVDREDGRTLGMSVPLERLKGTEALKKILSVWQEKRGPLDEVHLFKCSQITHEVLSTLPAVIFVE
ncbi:hypothetical protein EIP91_005452 [Steccherinum ochraceum]|uniref:Uncharacterized protein n=1 Tax=Steccherinum ochraceum TaxID=92696 RepID=A0A4R0RUH0_9APHY|nr:hypothetical protein EIP91_005452 [Steccherinum ochraceum]